MQRKMQNDPQYNPTGFDPAKAFMDRKRHEDDPSQLPTVEYDPEDIKALEDFCKKNGIVGFSAGKMNPKAALRMLKQQVGSAEDVIKSYENQGYTVVDKSYPKPKGILFG